ncbi:hypothetical protein O7616_18275 [Micromonospora sp. WMMD964]|nr:hypothetical protein [Micromonospora sp. WMMD964]WFE98855.1 hypothetical protein O7616_18275 [Micromonospora sp. WMMD964]
MSSGQQKAVIAVHPGGLDGRCSRCQTWWARLRSYPCWQVEWAIGRQTPTITAGLLAGAR